jgi:hypothetical protein
MADPQNGQHCVEALKVITTYLPALIISLLARCLLTASCLKLIKLSMLTEPCCGITAMAAWWVVGLSVHAVISVFLRFFLITKTSCCRTPGSDSLAFLRRCDAALILAGAVWTGLGLLFTLALTSEEAGALRRAIVLYGISTLIAYPGEVYVFYWRLVPLREELDYIADIYTFPQTYGRPKRGSIDCCAIVDSKELGDVDKARVRDCAICLQEIHPFNGKVRKTPCGHFFHEPCLQGWFRQGAGCPLCRVDCSTSTAALDDMLTEDP